MKYLLAVLIAALPLVALAAPGDPCTKYAQCKTADTPECHYIPCVDGKCAAKPRPVSGWFCNAGDPCTFADQCKAGVCTPRYRKQTPACVEPNEVLPLCEITATSPGQVLECPFRIDPSGGILTAVQGAAGVPDGLVFHGFFTRVGGAAVPLITTLDPPGMQLSTGHSVTAVPFDAARFPTVREVGFVVVNIANPKAALSVEPFAMRFVALGAGTWTVPASAVLGDAGTGKTTLEASLTEAGFRFGP